MKANNKIKENPRFNYQANFGKNNPLLINISLYEAAMDEFSSKDYQRASLNDILKKSQMPKSSFYYQFGDKLGLYLAVMDIIGDKKMAFFKERMANIDKDADFFTVVRHLTKETMDFMFIDPRLYHFSNLMMETDHEMIKVIMKYFPYDIQGSFGPLLMKAYEEKQINNKYPLPFVSRLLTVIMSNIDKMIDEKTTPDMAYKTMTMVFDVLENGIKE
ncbi:MAG: TetR/AcrR family transcriptional regulator [Erysipelotrichaceae bacterium]|nr:TetR/AcrR family transcriptional regulator [Erysipelotrichaceae bacterium]